MGLLLRAGSDLYQPRIIASNTVNRYCYTQEDSVLHWAITSRSSEIIWLVIAELANGRTELKAMALALLPGVFHSRFDLSTDRLPDMHASGIVEALQRSGKNIHDDTCTGKLGNGIQRTRGIDDGCSGHAVGGWLSRFCMRSTSDSRTKRVYPTNA